MLEMPPNVRPTVATIWSRNSQLCMKVHILVCIMIEYLVHVANNRPLVVTPGDTPVGGECLVKCKNDGTHLGSVSVGLHVGRK